jgi:hypothetical protein
MYVKKTSSIREGTGSMTVRELAGRSRGGKSSNKRSQSITTRKERERRKEEKRKDRRSPPAPNRLTDTVHTNKSIPTFGFKKGFPFLSFLTIVFPSSLFDSWFDSLFSGVRTATIVAKQLH